MNVQIKIISIIVIKLSNRRNYLIVKTILVADEWKHETSCTLSPILCIKSCSYLLVRIIDHCLFTGKSYKYKY